ncbi:MAG: DNA/RNA non-specific endonuclease [Pseudomonadota bacterium]
MNEFMKDVLRDKEVLEELRAGNLFKKAVGNGKSVAPKAQLETPLSEKSLRESLETLSKGQGNAEAPPPTEAIIMRHGYPILLVQDGTFETPELEVWKKRLSPHRKKINKAISSVGRVELNGHPQFNWLGTGWLLDENTIITNRHVAELFVESRDGRPSIIDKISVSLDFAEEHERSQELISGVKEVIHLEPGNGVDLALLRTDAATIKRLNLVPIPVSRSLSDQQLIATIGYPARDSRNNLSDQSRIFDDIYDVKRLAPGRVKQADASADTFTHICNTTGGNSGSVVIDINSGNAVGLHFAGREGVANWAVRPAAILDRAARAKVKVTVARKSGRKSGKKDSSNESSLEDLADRQGFDPHFLGTGKFTTPMPRLNPVQQTQAAKTNEGDFELKYTRFSVVMNKFRRLAFYTAVNIDGSSLLHKRRSKEPWQNDPRIDEEHQIDNIIYRHNDFDRGHLVRRLDPVWGEDDKALAARAEMDTYFYTNAAPQHKDLNRKVWLELEDHLLEHAEEEQARISVFTGPIFGLDDPNSRRDGLQNFQFPLGFWKVIASVSRRKRSRKLEAQAFVIWQDDIVDQDDLELIFGDGLGDDVLQVPIGDIERMTGLDFQNLRTADTLEEPEHTGEEALAAGRVQNRSDHRWVTIRDLDDIC